MKKLIAMVMTAAMVASLVPATAFAGDDVHATARVVNSWTRRDSDSLKVDNSGTDKAPELQLKITEADTQGTNPTGTYTVSVELDGASFDINGDKVLDAKDITTLKEGITVELNKDNVGTIVTPGAVTYDYRAATAAEIKDFLEALYDEVVDDTTIPADVQLYNETASTGNSSLSTNLINKTTVTSIIASGFTLPNVSGNTAEQNRDAAAVAYIKAKFNPSFSGSVTYDSNLTIDGKRQAGWSYGTNQLISEEEVVDWVKTGADGNTTVTNTFENGAFKNQHVANKDKTTWVADKTPNFVADTGKNISAAVKQVAAGTSSPAPARVITATVQTPNNVASTTDLNEIEFVITCSTGALMAGDYFKLDLQSVLDKAKTATVSVDSDDMTISNGDDLVYVSIENEGVTASIKKVATVAEEEHTTLEKNLVIKSTVGKFANQQVIELKLSNGFEFVKGKLNTTATTDYQLAWKDDDLVELTVQRAGLDKIEVAAADITIEAANAKAGATCTMTVKATNNVTNAFNAKTTVEVMKVVDYTVVLSVDEDDDVPVIYSGVNVKNYGINDDSDHLSLEVTVEESFPGAWSMRKGFNFELPEHVYVTDVDVTNAENFYQGGSLITAGKQKDAWETALFNAYQDGDHVNFEFDKRTFDDVNTDLEKDPASVSFKLELVADPTFSGDVTLKFTGDLVDEQEVTIAKFVKPYEVTAEQNDLIIDYRYTEIPTEITVTEAEEGLWDKDNAEFAFYVEKPDYIVFEDDPTYTVDKNSGLELDEDELKKDNWDGGNNDFEAIHFTVDKESDEAATVTISDLSLFMQRSIPAGAYDLKIWTSMADKYNAQQLFAADCMKNAKDTSVHSCTVKDNDCIVDDVCDYSKTVKEAFVNVVTAGRDQDDASFTTKVVVPVGENKITAGEVEYTIDAPAYINANGYTMLPVRAVATALGIKNDNVLWDQATKTVTILYGQRIITMQVGASVVYVNGAAIPASSSVEITNSRTFLGLRDLATALGVTDITWDASTKTATLNGGNTAE